MLEFVAIVATLEFFAIICVSFVLIYKQKHFDERLAVSEELRGYSSQSLDRAERQLEALKLSLRDSANALTRLNHICGFRESCHSLRQKAVQVQLGGGSVLTGVLTYPVDGNLDLAAIGPLSFGPNVVTSIQEAGE